MSNLIERKAALDALKKYQEEESDNFTDTNPLIMMTVATIASCIEIIVELPPADHDQICQFCDCYDKQSCYCNFLSIWTESDFYCKAWEPENTDDQILTETARTGHESSQG